MSIDMTEVILFFVVIIKLVKSSRYVNILLNSVDMLFIKSYCDLFINECKIIEIKLLRLFVNCFSIILEHCETIDMGLKLN